MGNVERTKKRALLWKKAIAHFSLCFVMGFFTGFFPTGTNKSPSNRLVPTYRPEPIETLRVPEPVEALRRPNATETPPASSSEEKLQRVKLSERAREREQGRGREQPSGDLEPRKLVIIVTPTSTSKGEPRGVSLRRLANTIGLVRPPLLWIVVEGQAESNEANEILRKTKVMYRHLVSKENFTEAEAEAELDHQRNVALKHIEKHRLSGIVHFAGLSNVYDLEFFDHLRKIEAFGTWPMAIVGVNGKKVSIEGPVCDSSSSQVIGWHLRKMKKNESSETDYSKPPIHISTFGFNSSILWDPERWGRTSSDDQSTSQSSITFVKQVVVEDETEIKGIPEGGCSKIMLWTLQFPNRDKPINQSLVYDPKDIEKQIQED